MKTNRSLSLKKQKPINVLQNVVVQPAAASPQVVEYYDLISDAEDTQPLTTDGALIRLSEVIPDLDYFVPAPDLASTTEPPPLPPTTTTTPPPPPPPPPATTTPPPQPSPPATTTPPPPPPPPAQPSTSRAAQQPQRRPLLRRGHKDMGKMLNAMSTLSQDSSDSVSVISGVPDIDYDDVSDFQPPYPARKGAMQTVVALYNFKREYEELQNERNAETVRIRSEMTKLVQKVQTYQAQIQAYQARLDEIEVENKLSDKVLKRLRTKK